MTWATSTTSPSSTESAQASARGCTPISAPAPTPSHPTSACRDSGTHRFLFTGDAEVAVDAPGQQVVLDGLLDWLLVCTLREWFERAGSEQPGWWAAQRDAVVGEALRLLHAAPAAPWTVAALAERIGVSRSTLAQRFARLVGEAPLTYLTRWRMTLAADLLLEPGAATVADVAHTVGYADAFAFSTAFKRVRGSSPSDFRHSSTAS